jgi:hypothetical protein
MTLLDLEKAQIPRIIFLNNYPTQLVNGLEQYRMCIVYDLLKMCLNFELVEDTL